MSLEFDVKETNRQTHEAVGHVNWRNFTPKPFDGNYWKAVHADAAQVFFGEDVSDDHADTVVIVARIRDKEGWGQGESGEYAYFWLRDGGADPDEWAMKYYSFDPWYEFYPPDSPPAGYFTLAEAQEEDPVLPLASEAGDLVIDIGEPALQEAAGLRRIEGEFGFPSPEVWGVDLWITQDFDVAELDAVTHEATGSLDFGVYNVEQRAWKRVKSEVMYALFDEASEAAMVVSRITDKQGEGAGEPGEYACFWVRDGGPVDQFGIHYYSDFHPEAGFKEYFPADELPALEYAAPRGVIDVENGDLAILR